MLKMLAFTLQKAGYEVLQAVNGQEGLDVLGENAVDVIITDINMPVMDGLTVHRAAARGQGALRPAGSDPDHREFR